MQPDTPQAIPVDQPTVSSPQVIQPPITASTQEQPPKGSQSSKVLLLIIIVLLLFLIVVGVVGVILLITKSGDEKDKDTTSKDTTVSEQQEEETTVETTSEDTNEIAAMWDTYENTKWKFSIKHPKDLAPTEGAFDAKTDQIVFQAGEPTAFTIWIKTEGEMGNNLSNMLSNQCTDKIDYTTVTLMGNKFRKAIEVPMEGCLEALGTVRTYELCAFGIDLPGGAQLLIRNDGLNQEQLEGVLKSLEFI